MENEKSENNNIEIKKERYCPKKPKSEATAWRFREDGTYNTCSSLEVYRRYYHEVTRANGPKACELCGRVIVNVAEMKRHQRTNICAKYSALRLNESLKVPIIV